MTEARDLAPSPPSLPFTRSTPTWQPQEKGPWRGGASLDGQEVDRGGVREAAGLP